MSRSFYEKLGDDIANELVDWFNQVDATYKSDLRELADSYFARFDAKLEQRVAELRQELGSLRADFRTELHSQIGGVRAELAAFRADLVKWMLLFWVGTALTVIGLLKF